MVMAPPLGDRMDWLGLSPESLPVAEALAWASALPGDGAVVCFCGNVRDHAPGRPSVERLHYEAYSEGVERVLGELAGEARRRWPALGRLALLHRLGTLAVGEAAVVVIASAPHREEAFAAARWAIDAVKERAPIWKYETWSGGEGWSEDDHAVGVPALPGAST
ncbi:MAG: molybdopterin synthase large subunit MoaE [Acidimicrobiaceae bacterium]|nr:molybdopterin synthase large subunit MoaE [Acidimicrobiaceae bacterium]